MAVWAPIRTGLLHHIAVCLLPNAFVRRLQNSWKYFAWCLATGQ